MRKILTKFILVALAALAGCAPIEHTTKASQEVNRQQIAGPGDQILHVDRQRNLENVFGQSDIFGRKTNEGFSELYFQGVETDGTMVLYRMSTTIITNETTMSRTPITQTFANTTGDVGVYGNTANFNATTMATTITPAQDYHVVVPDGVLAIRLPPGTRSVPFEGYIVEIIGITSTALTYRISPAAQ